MQLVMFDIDGTLTASNRADDACFVQASADVFGFTQVDSDWSTYPHCTDTGILATLCERRLGRPPAAAEVAAMQARLVELLMAAAEREPILEIPGAAVLVERLLADPARAVSLASGAWEISARLKLASAGLRLPGVAGAFAENGPAREAIMGASYELAARACGRRAFDSVIYIGDGVWDVRASKNLGWPCLGIAADPAHAARLRAAGAVDVLPDFRNIQVLLNALES